MQVIAYVRDNYVQTVGRRTDIKSMTSILFSFLPMTGHTQYIMTVIDVIKKQ
jgi:hypothetical protein